MPRQILGGIDGCAAFVGNDYEFGMMASTTGLTEAAAHSPWLRSPSSLEAKRARRFTPEAGERLEVPVAKPSQVVDPTGAGDAYLAGLTFGLSRKVPIEVAGRMAALAATYCIELKGCQEHRYAPADFRQRYLDTFGQSLEGLW